MTGERCDYVGRRIVRNSGTSEIENFFASPVNTALQRIRVVDMSLEYKWETSMGTLVTEWAWSHILKNVTKEQSDDDYQNERDLRTRTSDFRSRLSASLAYINGGFTTRLTGLRRGTHPRYNNSASLKRNGAYITFNWTAYYEYKKDLMFGVRVNNVFDELPVDDSFSSTQYPWYSHIVYSGAGIGREAVLEVQFSF